MKKDKTIYPDVSDIRARKAQGRREAARRSLGEKIALVDMRERLAPLKSAPEMAAKNKRAQVSPRRSKG